MTKKAKKKPELESSEVKRRKPSPYWAYGLLAVILLFFGLIRLRLLDIPLERDEGEYAYAGQLLLHGIPPYKLAYNMKLPGTYAAYALILALFGQTPAGIHFGLLLVNAATTILVFFLAKRLLGGLAGVVSAASYALLSTSPAVLGFAGHATHFVVLPAVAGIWLLLKAIESKRTWLYFASGLLLGVAFLMKQPGIFFVLFAGIYLANSEWRRPVDWRRLALRVVAFSFGVAFPFVLTCLLLAWAGVFHKFWFWTFVYARTYGTALGVLDGSHVLWTAAPVVMGPTALLWIIAAVGLTAFLWNPEARAHTTFLTGFLLFSFLAVCPGFYFRQHYFILMLPAVSLLAGAAVSSTTRRLREKRQTGMLPYIPVLIFLAALAYTVVNEQDFLFNMDSLMACRSLYAPNPFPEALKVADYLKSHTSDGTRIAILGSEPEIYFYAQRPSATGYIYMYPLMEEQSYAPAMQKEMISEIEAARPEYLVNVNVLYSWIVRPNTDPLVFTWSQKYLQERYELVGIADILELTEYRWGDAAKTYRPLSPYTVQVYKIKSP